MATVRRYDSLPLKAIRLDNGFLRAPARIARVGIQNYRQPDGTVRRELRPAEEVFHPDSLASFALVPVTDDHPGPVTGENAKQHQVGTLGENLTQDGDFLAGTVMITDSAAVAKVDAGKTQLSCGYTCDVEDSPGTWRGQQYDGIQRNIRGNHLALVHVGRAGPEVRLRLDSGDAVAIMSSDEQPSSTANPSEAPAMTKIKLDGVDFEVSESAAQAIAKMAKAHEDAVASSKSDLTKQTARADVAEAQVKDLTAKLTAAQDPKAIQTAVAARVALETTGREVLGNGFKADMSDDEIRKAVIAKRLPALKLDGKTADAIAATFEAAMVTPVTAGTPGTAPLPKPRQDEGGSAYAKAYAKFHVDTEQAWKTPADAK